MSLYLRLVLRFSAYHCGILTAVVLVFVALGASYSGLAAFTQSARDAVASSVRADNGNQAYAIQILNAGRASEILAANPNMHPVRDYAAVLTAGSRQSPTSVRVLRDAIPVGILTSGAFPRKTGDATVSAHLASVLSIKVGDSVIVSANSGENQLRVTGIVIKPEDGSYDGVVALDSGLATKSADLWLTNHRPFSDPILEPLLQSGDLAARTTSILAQDRAAEFGTTLYPAVRQVSGMILILAAVLAVLLLAVMAGATRREVIALSAAGLNPVKASSLPVAVGLSAMVTGAGAGSALALAALSSARSSAAQLAGQDWTHVIIPWTSIMLLLLVVVGGNVAGIIVVQVVRRYRPRYTAAWPVRPWISAALVLLGLALMLLPFIDVLPVESAIPGGIVLTLAVPGLVIALTSLGVPPATRRLLLVSVTPFALAGMFASLLSFGSSYYSAYVTHAGIASIRSSPAVQPTGSFLIYNVTSTAAQTLRDEYDRLGGRRTATYQLPVENTHTLRASSEKLVGCMRESGTEDPMEHTDCLPKDTSSPVNVVALSSTLRPDQALADPGFLQGRQVGLIDFDRATSVVKSLDVIAATADETLGGNMPGLVISPDSSVAKRYKLKASDAELLALLDFDTLSESSRAEFRAAVTRTAATAQTAELSNERLPELTIGVWTAVAGAVAVCLLWIGLGMVITATQTRQRSLYAAVGASPSQRRALAARLLLPTFACFLATGVIAISAAWVSGVHDGSPFGWWWILPPIAGMAGATGIALHHARPASSA